MEALKTPEPEPVGVIVTELLVELGGIEMLPVALQVTVVPAGKPLTT